MIELSASVSKKVPVPDVEFSSHCVSAGIEIEVASGASEDEVKERLRGLYGMLEESIDEQIGQQQTSEQNPGNSNGPAPTPKSNNGPTSTNKHNGRTATKAQVRAIYAIAKERSYTEESMKELLSGTYGVEVSSALSIGQASTLIDALKNNGQE